MKNNFMLTSESVTDGNPDKLCDIISDAIVDHFLKQDPYSRIIAECSLSASIVFIAARFSSEAVFSLSEIARKVIASVGYQGADFNARTSSVLTSIKELPLDPVYRFDERKLTFRQLETIPAGNQVTTFGFACRQNAALMPLPIWLAHKLSRRMADAAKEKILPYLCPEAKTDVGIEYRDRRPSRIHSITITASQKEAAKPELEKLRADIREAVIEHVFRDEPLRPDPRTQIFINPEGVFHLGGPSVHSGLTGRKTAIDTYGDYSRHSGAALSGKDPLRIDRVGAYAARYAAKNLVAAELADECEVQLSYSISRSRPESVQVETFGTGKIPDEKLTSLLLKHFDFRLAAIVRDFQLRRLPAKRQGEFYRKLAVYGQVGRLDLDLPWEKTDKADLLKGS
ncbi:MAG TPA: methionine adenosyltransferase [Deltaproteobacteria bacterium]|jgi:S-adenosylmethionine synthetase|nr:methionine adenosyltransferase [Deltaproteobacteria bacterium]